jgi:hypothetical protein
MRQGWLDDVDYLVDLLAILLQPIKNQHSRPMVRDQSCTAGEFLYLCWCTHKVNDGVKCVYKMLMATCKVDKLLDLKLVT